MSISLGSQEIFDEIELTLIGKWDERFLGIAREVSTWSKDPSTKVGAVAVRNKRILSTGYNGFPRGVDDSPERYADREYKLSRIVHAEKNAVYNAGLNGVSLRGATMYVFGCPLCHLCAPAIIQSGIRRVVQRFPDKFLSGDNDWCRSSVISREVFSETGVILVSDVVKSSCSASTQAAPLDEAEPFDDSTSGRRSST